MVVGIVLALWIRFPDWLWSANAPAWVQAIGAVLALAVTVALSRSDAHERRLESAARRRSAAITLYPLFVDLRDGVRWALEKAETGASPNELGYDRYGEPYSVGSVVRISPDLKIAFAYAEQLGAAASAVQSAYHAVSRFEDFAEKQYEDDGDPDDSGYSTWSYGEIWRRVVTLQPFVDEATRVLWEEVKRR
jgi:hypothetical protein